MTGRRSIVSSPASASPRPTSSPSSAGVSSPSCLPRLLGASPSTIRCSAKPASASPVSPGAGTRSAPHFQTNFVRAQRVLQISASLPLAHGAYRMVPTALLPAPTPPKPSPRASAHEVQEYRQAARRARLPWLAAQQSVCLRQALDAEPNGSQAPLLLFVDGGYTHGTVAKKLPPRTTLVGRIRKDAQLYFLPQPPPAPKPRGRPRPYGAPAPTPEPLRMDDSAPWTSVDVSLSAAPHALRVKRLKDILWRPAGLHHTLPLVVIAPLGYRLRKHSKLLYRRPAFLICTDPELDLHALVQGFVQRWNIEVNFREEKILLGVGQAQVRNADSVEALPALPVASYALLLATLRAFQGPVKPHLLPPPKWAADTAPRRFSTQRAIQQLPAEVWGRALALANFSGFAAPSTPTTKPQKFLPDLPSALLYAVN